MDKTKAWLFIVNPCAGKGKHSIDKIIVELETWLDSKSIDYFLVKTERKYHAIELVAQFVREGYRRFVSVGGDGTASEVINGLCMQDIALLETIRFAQLPVGTGNDWAAYYGLPHSVKHFVTMLDNEKTVKQDIGVVEYTESEMLKKHYFLNFVGTGFDTYVLRHMGSGQGNRARYFIHVLKCLRSYRSPQYQIDSGSIQEKGQSLMIMVCLGKFGGAGMKFAPSAQIDDGLFNIVNIRDMPFIKRLMSLAYLFNGKVNQHPKVSAHEVSHLEISSSETAWFQCDGEIVAELPIKVAIKPRALTVVVAVDYIAVD